MKKHYIKPVVETIHVIQTQHLLSGSDIKIQSGRYAGGGPTTTTGPKVSGEIDQTSGSSSGYGYGQGSPYDSKGGGNRSKAWSTWD